MQLCVSEQKSQTLPLVDECLSEVSQQDANKEPAYALRTQTFAQHYESSAMWNEMTDWSFHDELWRYLATEALKPRQGFC